MNRKFNINAFLGFEPHVFWGEKPEPPTSRPVRELLLQAMERSELWLSRTMPRVEEAKRQPAHAPAITTLSPEQFVRQATDRPVTYGFARTAFGIWQVNGIEGEGIVSAFRFSEADSVPPLSERIGFGQRPYRRNDAMAREAVDVALGRREGHLHLCFVGRPLQWSVWQALLLIPRGFVFSYDQLARLAGHPRAVRAVASCVARNELGLIVPCQRIVRKSGDIGKYAWDPSLKWKIIQYEQEHR